MPHSFTSALPALRGAAPPEVAVPAPDLIQLQRRLAERRDRNPVAPPAFATDAGGGWDLGNSGVWVTLPDGGRVWRLALRAPGATSVGLTFDRYALPEGAALFLYTPDRSVVRGAFTHENNKARGGLATAPIRSSAVVLEYHEPAGVVGQGALSVGSLWYGFAEPAGGGQLTAAQSRRAAGPPDDEFGTASSCTVNVECHADDYDVSNGRRSTVLLILEVGGSLQAACTGALVNDTVVGFRPFILTAAHCFGQPSAQGSAITLDLGFDSVVAVFNYESSSCQNPPVMPHFDQSASGAELKTYHGRVDVLLLEMKSAIPRGYGAWYSGWTSSTSAPPSTYGIHHPRGDIKKISIDYDSPDMFHESKLGLANSNIEVLWDVGASQVGSSGSPLFDLSGRVLGALSGFVNGERACQTDGSARTEVRYGALHAFWGIDYSSDQYGTMRGLRHHLASGNAGVTSVAGAQQPLPPISPPQNLAVTNYPSQGSPPGLAPPELDWDDHPSPRFSSYTVYRKDPWSPNPGAFRAVASGLTSSAYTDHDMTLEEHYGTEQVRYHVKAESGDGQLSSPSNAVVVEAERSHFRRGVADDRLPEVFGVHAQNPTQGAVRVEVSLPERMRVRAEVYDVLGRRVAVLADRTLGVGRHGLEWRAGGRASGRYLVRVTAVPVRPAAGAPAEYRETLMLSLLR